MGRTPPSFTSTIFFMAMKAHRQGRPTTALLRLLSHKTIHDTSDAFVELRTSKARIRNGSLLLRDQRVFMFSAPLRPPLTVDGRFEFCRHNVFTNLDDLGFCRIHVPSPDEINDYVSKEGVIYCKYCHTEIRIDFKSYGKARTAMFVTRWMDVGEGRDVDDVKWKFRLASRTEWEEVSFARGSICAAFEGTDDFRFDSLLTEQDEMDLCIMCPLTWPESAQVPDHDWEQGYEVVDGKMVFIDNGAERACFCIHDD
ncbi:hypothetical protein V494_07652 [Pseudogymnoascus sp. VKM F-4513 (FW-928)]|nr:hypothetical protein V494_07652 [Pseudogymnoascus sp. VKM F-4513 (FW-928)]